ncbi:MAG TPA: chlorhexidine efflux transporter [Nevskiaceae bacterium]
MGGWRADCVSAAADGRAYARGRSLSYRIGHALGFEAGMTIALAPLFMWLSHISVIRAALLNFGTSAFFLVYTLVYTWAFDRAFWLPSRARATPTRRAAAPER